MVCIYTQKPKVLSPTNCCSNERCYGSTRKITLAKENSTLTRVVALDQQVSHQTRASITSRSINSTTSNAIPSAGSLPVYDATLTQVAGVSYLTFGPLLSHLLAPEVSIIVEFLR